MNPDLQAAVAAIGRDRLSGASALLPRAIEVLRVASEEGPETLVAAARAVCHAQPSMAGIWNAAAVVLGGGAGALDRFAGRSARAPAAIARFARDVLAEPHGAGRRGALRVVTYSASGAVHACLNALAERQAVTVACAEGRPGLEGRRLAAGLAQQGFGVEIYTDGGIAAALHGATAVLLGADAVAGRWFVNKCGSSLLVAAAAGWGVPVYVAAGREKLVAPALIPHLQMRAGPPDEVWEAPPPGVIPRNPSFERVPVDALSAVILDVGLLGVDLLEDACRSAPWDARLASATSDL